MAGERLRMRPWLECQINDSRIPGLVWIEKSRGVFKVPWKHAGKPGFVLERDALLFKEWARHTGKYKEGDQPDPSTWKTRFRCALHKLPDIIELKDESSLDGEEPYRVFQLLPKGTRNDRLESAPSPAFTDVSVSPGPPMDLTPDESNVFGAFQIQENGDNEVDQLQASIIDDYSVDEWDDSTVEQLNLLGTNDYVNGLPDYLEQAAAVGPPLSAINDMIGMNPAAMQVGVKIFYKANQVLEKNVENHYGCRLYSGVDVTRAPGYNESLALVYGPPQVEQIRFPDEGSVPEMMEKLNRGLLLEWQQNSIQATRFCQAHVYASGGCLGSNNIIPLGRGQPTKVFDYNFFLAGLADYKLSKAPVPLYEVFFSFGQQPATATTVDPGVLVAVSVTHMNAKASISKMGSASDVVMSIEDEGDILAKQLQQIVKIHQPNP